MGLGIALITCAILALGGLAFFYYSAPRPVALRNADLCPESGPRGVSAVLVDTSDDLFPTTQKEVRTLLADQISDLPSYYKLDLRVLDNSKFASRSLFARCNPGDGTDQSELTSNPTILRQRWLESFNKPAEDAIHKSLSSPEAKSSPIMGAIQDIALDDYSSESSRGIPKALTVISDMLEFTPYYGQYPSQGDLSYDRFRRSPAYQKFRTDLHGARVTIDYVVRSKVKINTVKHVQFWSDWINDNRGKVALIHRLQG